jgi:hypothetical protein
MHAITTHKKTLFVLPHRGILAPPRFSETSVVRTMRARAGPRICLFTRGCEPGLAKEAHVTTWREYDEQARSSDE